jgi:enoyl-CoA hydratase/carnithine racemase
MTSTVSLPDSLEVDLHGDVAVLRLNRPHKRNALDDTTVLGIEAFFADLPAGVAAVVLDAAGDHFSAGLDLAELTEVSTFDGVLHSMMWHRVFERIELGTVPVIAVLKGAVVGGGLELACAAHLRVAESSTFYALPEGQRGIFVGGGGSVRVPRLIGVSRMADMMLTGRVYDAEEGQAAGLSHYLTGPGEGLDHALTLAKRVAENTAITNFAILQALPRIAEANPREGFLLEALMGAVAQGGDEAKARMQAFLDGRAAKVAKA